MHTRASRLHCVCWSLVSFPVEYALNSTTSWPPFTDVFPCVLRRLCRSFTLPDLLLCVKCVQVTGVALVHAPTGASQTGVFFELSYACSVVMRTFSLLSASSHVLSCNESVTFRVGYCFRRFLRLLRVGMHHWASLSSPFVRRFALPAPPSRIIQLMYLFSVCLCVRRVRLAVLASLPTRDLGRWSVLEVESLPTP